MISRSLRSETRSRAREDNKRVLNSIKRVRRWEKKWVALKDTTMCIFKWVPSAIQDLETTPAGKKPRLAPRPLVMKDTFSMSQSANGRVTVGDETNGLQDDSLISVDKELVDPDATGVSASQENSQMSFSSSKKGPDSITMDDSESMLNEDSNMSFPNLDSNHAPFLNNEDEDTGSDFMSALSTARREDSDAENAKENGLPEKGSDN